ncbi:MAG: ferrochelatase, partial [Elusimicrobia bacterium]|nr:ferrochelatase [Candidatus Obscuribacterium magneticum]
LPLYPQYSFTTTKGGEERVIRSLKKWNRNAKLFQIKSWPTHPLFIQAHAELIESELKKFSSSTPELPTLLFSAHSIPEKWVAKLGDPYKRETEATVDAILKKLGWRGPWRLAWQSKLGPVKWIGPGTMEVLQGLGRGGITKVLVVPVSFVTDHVETLYEIDIFLSEAARKAGIVQFRRTPGLNTHPTFIKALGDLVLSRKDFWNDPFPLH